MISFLLSLWAILYNKHLLKGYLIFSSLLLIVCFFLLSSIICPLWIFKRKSEFKSLQVALVLDESKLHLRIRRIWNIISLQIAIKISITTNHQLNFARVFDQCTTGHLGWQNNWLLTVTLHSSYNSLWWIK